MATAGQGVIIKEVLCRHPHHDIRLDPALTRLAISHIPGFIAQKAGARRFQVAGFEDDSTFAAHAFAPTRGIDMDPGFGSCQQQVFPLLDLDGFLVRIKGELEGHSESCLRHCRLLTDRCLCPA